MGSGAVVRPPRVGGGARTRPHAGKPGLRHAVGSTPAPTPIAGHADERLVSAADRSRLQALMTARQHESGEVGYRIGPDDLLDVRIPDLLPPTAAGTGTRAAAIVAETPAFQQGLRVNAQGDVAIPLLGIVPAAGQTPTALEAEIASAPEGARPAARSAGDGAGGRVSQPRRRRRRQRREAGALPADAAERDARRHAVGGGRPGEGRGPRGRVPAAGRCARRRSRADPARPRRAPARPGERSGVGAEPAGAAGRRDQRRGGRQRAGGGLGRQARLVSGDARPHGARRHRRRRRHALSGRPRAACTCSARSRPARSRSSRSTSPRIGDGTVADLPLADGDVVWLPASTARLVPYGLWDARPRDGPRRRQRSAFLTEDVHDEHDRGEPSPPAHAPRTSPRARRRSTPSSARRRAAPSARLPARPLQVPLARRARASR